MTERTWVRQAVEKIDADERRSSDTHLLKLDVPKYPNIDVYLKDESTHPTGSLKHRLARSLFLYGLCNGQIQAGQTIVEASSGSTAVSEAYFARLIGVSFIAVMPQATAQRKIDQIKHYGGRCHFVESACQMDGEARRLAAEIGGHFMDQFMFAERATDWRGNNNIAESIFDQMALERYPVPRMIVMGAGTGGTSATIGRYIRYKGYETDVTVVDPEHSVFYESFQTGNRSLAVSGSSKIEGIGRPRVEASFQPDVIDEMIKVPDAASIAAMRWLSNELGRTVGPSTGTNLWGVLQIAERMAAAGQSGSIVTLLCDSGDRYLDTYYDPAWVRETFGDVSDYAAALDQM